MLLSVQRCNVGFARLAASWSGIVTGGGDVRDTFVCYQRV